MVTVQQSQETALAERIAQLWGQARGSQPGRVRLHLSRSRAVVWIEKCLSPGEIVSAHKTLAARSMQAGLEELASDIQIEVVQALEALFHCPVQVDGVQADLDKNWVMCSYQLYNGAALF